MTKNKNNQTIWNTRIKNNNSSLFQKVGNSIEVDKRLYKEDIAGSIAHAEMLFKQKIISFKIKNKIIYGLNKIEKEITRKKFEFKKKPLNQEFDEVAQKDFLKGAKIAYETIITDFSDSDNKLIASKPLLGKKIHDQFKEALLERTKNGHYAEITFIGVKSAVIKSHRKVENSLEVTVDFISEIITCIRDKEKKLISG